MDQMIKNYPNDTWTIAAAKVIWSSWQESRDDIEDDLKEEKIIILKEYNKYLSFMEKYFSNKNAEPLPTGLELSKHIFG